MIIIINNDKITNDYIVIIKNAEGTEIANRTFRNQPDMLDAVNELGQWHLITDLIDNTIHF